MPSRSWGTRLCDRHIPSLRKPWKPHALCGEKAKRKKYSVELVGSTETSRVYGPSFLFERNLRFEQEDAGKPRDTPRGHSESRRSRRDRQNRRREIDRDRGDLLEYRAKVKRRKYFNKKSDINNLEYITADLLEFYDPVTRLFEHPKHWLNGRKSVVGELCDDRYSEQSTPLIGSKKFTNLRIKCRHVGSLELGEPLIGVSIFLAVQNYTAQGNECIQ